jgi:mannose-6-phosphate isomerase-like protein (cupin superfamily)
MQNNREASVLADGEGKRLNVLGDGVTIKARTGAYTVIEVDSVQAGPPLHRHDWDETYFVLSGAMDVQVGQRVVRATTGMSIHIPGGTAHSYSTRETGRCRFLATVAPGVAADFFIELHNATEHGRPDMSQVMAIAQRHGITPA